MAKFQPLGMAFSASGATIGGTFSPSFEQLACSISASTHLYDPTDAPNIFAWHDAELSTQNTKTDLSGTVPGNNDPVGYVQDLVSGTYPLGEAGGSDTNRMVLKTNVLNGFAVWQFDAAVPSYAYFLSAPAITSSTYSWVTRFTAAHGSAAGSYIGGFGRIGAHNLFILGIDGGNSDRWLMVGLDSGGASGIIRWQPMDNNWHVVTLVRTTGADITTSGVTELYIDGVLQTKHDTSGTSGSANPNPSDLWMTGCLDSGGSTNGWTGQIADQVICNGALTGTDLTDLINYQKDRFGL